MLKSTINPIDTVHTFAQELSLHRTESSCTIHLSRKYLKSLLGSPQGLCTKKTNVFLMSSVSYVIVLFLSLR